MPRHLAALKRTVWTLLRGPCLSRPSFSAFPYMARLLTYVTPPYMETLTWTLILTWTLLLGPSSVGR